MVLQRVFSKNAAWQKFEVLKTNRNKRHRYGQFFVEGVRNLNEAVRQGWQVDAWIYALNNDLSDWARQMLASVSVTTHYGLSADLMAELSGKTDPSELCAIVRMLPENATLQHLHDKEPPLLLLFDRPSNKGNLGTLIRTCDALGVDQMIITGHGVDRYDPDVIAASMGSLFKVKPLYLPDNQSVRNWIDSWLLEWPELQIIGTTAHKAAPVNQADLLRPTLWIIGNETDGMSRWLQEQCECLATIPMDRQSTASSLNVSCAATVILYETIRQRQKYDHK